MSQLVYDPSNVDRIIFKFLSILKPGFINGGCFLRDTATQTTRMPTQTTTTVADTGTITSKSIHSGSPGKPDLVSAVFVLPPNGGARVPEKED